MRQANCIKKETYFDHCPLGWRTWQLYEFHSGQGLRDEWHQNGRSKRLHSQEGSQRATWVAQFSPRHILNCSMHLPLCPTSEKAPHHPAHHQAKDESFSSWTLGDRLKSHPNHSMAITWNNVLVWVSFSHCYNTQNI